MLTPKVTSGAKKLARKAAAVLAEINAIPCKRRTKDFLSGKVDVLSYNDLYLEDFPPFNVSRNHSLIDKIEGRYFVIDRGSRLGTIVNGKRTYVQSVLTKKENKVVVGS